MLCFPEPADIFEKLHDACDAKQKDVFCHLLFRRNADERFSRI